MEELNNTNFADLADKLMKGFLDPEKKNKQNITLTNTKIRNLYAMLNGAYSQAKLLRGEILTEDIMHDIQYAKMRFAYEAGKEDENKNSKKNNAEEINVKKFLEKANIMKYLDEIGDSKAKLLLFCNYFESLVAYHRFYGGKNR